MPLASSVVHQSTVNTNADNDDDANDDAEKSDVTADHSQHLLLRNMGSCTTTESVFQLSLSSVVIVVAVMVFTARRDAIVCQSVRPSVRHKSKFY